MSLERWSQDGRRVSPVLGISDKYLNKETHILGPMNEGNYTAVLIVQSSNMSFTKT